MCCKTGCLWSLIPLLLVGLHLCHRSLLSMTFFLVVSSLSLGVEAAAGVELVAGGDWPFWLQLRPEDAVSRLAAQKNKHGGCLDINSNNMAR